MSSINNLKREKCHLLKAEMKSSRIVNTDAGSDTEYFFIGKCTFK
jgi:hypothetical protein